ncbi:MAG: YicC family protein [Candidatus Omnitrophica bacterium]|nr:YicC family protein [Candidatus Omnitrophota bacterium]
MIRSMTGYGQASLGSGKHKCSVEIRSLNHRYFDYSARIPQVLLTLEEPIKQLIHSHIQRGKITLSLSLNEGEALLERVRIDEEKLGFYHKSLLKVASKLGMEKSIRIADIIHLPGIFVFEKEAADAGKWWPTVKLTVERALRNLISMREKEGRCLELDFVKRLGMVDRLTKNIRRRSRGMTSIYRERLTERIKELTGGLGLDKDRLLKESAVIAERSDITEELVRLENHVKLCRSALKEREEAGKRLDFIMQEMNREANTIASKSVDFGISSDVVRVKSEIEKMREQVQNIE